MTANAMQGDRELCEAAGMDDYVAKPIRVEELVAALERCPRRPEAAARAAPTARRSARRRRRAPGDPRRPLARRQRGRRRRRARSTAPSSTGSPRRWAAPSSAELIDTFVEDGRDLVAALRRARGRTDVDAFRRAAHSLKSNGETPRRDRASPPWRGSWRPWPAAAPSTGPARGSSSSPREYERVAASLGEIRHDLSP